VTPHWWAVLVLGAVFAMHGLQCAGGDSSGTTPGHGTAGPVLVLETAVAGSLHDPATTVIPVPPPEPAGSHAADPEPTAGAGSIPQPAGSLDHLWAACLAVLSATLALLGAVVRHAGGTGTPPVPRSPRRRWVGTPHRLRPPDIYSLCVLRN
jgi:hypothetical protein